MLGENVNDFKTLHTFNFLFLDVSTVTARDRPNKSIYFQLKITNIIRLHFSKN